MKKEKITLEPFRYRDETCNQSNRKPRKHELASAQSRLEIKERVFVPRGRRSTTSKIEGGLAWRAKFGSINGQEIPVNGARRRGPDGLLHTGRKREKAKKRIW